jgi:hypothetical protein
MEEFKDWPKEYLEASTASILYLSIMDKLNKVRETNLTPKKKKRKKK